MYVSLSHGGRGWMTILIWGIVGLATWPVQSADDPNCPESKPAAAAQSKPAAKQTQEEQMQAQIKAAQEAYEAEQRELAARLKNDPAWKPTHQEVRVIKLEGLQPEGLHNYCLDAKGNILACCGGERVDYEQDGAQMKARTISEANEVRVLSPEGKLLGSWKLDATPQAICVHSDGTVFVGGQGRLHKLAADGKVVLSGDAPNRQPLPPLPDKKDLAKETPEAAQAKQAKLKQLQAESEKLLKEIQEIYNPAQSGNAQDQKQAQQKREAKGEELVAKYTRLAEQQQDLMIDPLTRAIQKRAEILQRAAITGIAVTERDVFVAGPASKGFGSSVWRMDHDFKNAVEIVKGLSGCCGQMDIQTYKGDLWIPENGRHRVSHYDRTGKLLASFGKRDRKDADGFGGCCEPKNIRFGANGDVYTAESGTPVAVKRFTAEGKFLGCVAVPSYKTGCVRVTVEVSRDGQNVFILNPGENSIHVFAAKK